MAYGYAIEAERGGLLIIYLLNFLLVLRGGKEHEILELIWAPILPLTKTPNKNTHHNEKIEKVLRD